MPRKPLRKKQPRAGLTTGQEDQLLYGFMLCGDKGFDTVAEEKAAWNLHREKLLNESKPCSRPAAYWKFEKKITELMHIFDQAHKLLELGLLLEDEIPVYKDFIEVYLGFQPKKKAKKLAKLAKYANKMKQKK